MYPAYAIQMTERQCCWRAAEPRPWLASGRKRRFLVLDSSWLAWGSRANEMHGGDLAAMRRV